MTQDLNNTVKELKKEQGITIRRVDKMAAFVLISTEEYHKKQDDILKDETKF